MKYKLGEYVKIIQEWNHKEMDSPDRSGEVGKLSGIRTSKKSKGHSPDNRAFKQGYKYRVKTETDDVVVFKIKKATKQEIKEYMIDLL